MYVECRGGVDLVEVMWFGKGVYCVGGVLRWVWFCGRDVVR